MLLFELRVSSVFIFLIQNLEMESSFKKAQIENEIGFPLVFLLSRHPVPLLPLGVGGIFFGAFLRCLSSFMQPRLC